MQIRDLSHTENADLFFLRTVRIAVRKSLHPKARLGI
jgi:hypothetical protein